MSEKKTEIKNSEKNIIIADSCNFLIKLLKIKLTEKGFRVYTALNSNDLLTSPVLSAGENTAIILDPYLPGMDVLALLRKLRGDSRNAKIPIILHSAAKHKSRIIQCIKAGANEIVLKPAPINVILKKVYKVFDSVYLTREEKVIKEKTAQFPKLIHAFTPVQKIELIIKNVNTLIALPFSVVKVIKLCNDEKSSASDFKKPVESDPALATIILKKANSVAYAAQDRISSIPRAVGRIGLRETRNIAVAISVFKLIARDTTTSGFNRLEVWEHSLGVAVWARFIATAIGYPKPDDAFLAGLIHDIGKIILDDFLQEEFQAIVDKSFLESQPLNKLEKEILKIDHPSLGRKILEKWNFPEYISSAVGSHHTVLKEENAGIMLHHIISLADCIAKALQIGCSGDSLVGTGLIDIPSIFDKLVNMDWQRAIKKTSAEIMEYANILKIPAKFFVIDIIREKKGTVALILGDEPYLNVLLGMFLFVIGIECKAYESFDDVKKEEKPPDFIITNIHEIEQQKDNLPRYILLGDKKKAQLEVDFVDLKKEIFALTYRTFNKLDIHAWLARKSKKISEDIFNLSRDLLEDFFKSLPYRLSRVENLIMNDNLKKVWQEIKLIEDVFAKFEAESICKIATRLQLSAASKEKRTCKIYFEQLILEIEQFFLK